MTSLGRAITAEARARPDDQAIVFAPVSAADTTLSWDGLDRRSNRLARLFADHHLGQGGVVGVGLPNCPDHMAVTIAAWKLGACVVPLRWDLPSWELDRLLAVLAPTLLVADWDQTAVPTLSMRDLDRLDGYSDEELPDRVPKPATGIATGGSTGRPKIVMRLAAGQLGSWLPHSDRGLRGHGHGVQLIASPLYHTNGFVLGQSALLQGDTVVLMERFDAARALDLIERQHVNSATMVATMLARMIRLPDIATRDLSSLDYVRAGGAPCPAWLARRWIDLLGPDRFLIGYGASERIGGTTITGREWLTHPGSVGRPVDAEVKILSEDGTPLAPGNVGNIFMRATGEPEWPPFEYRGATVEPTRSDEFISVGDLGWVDDQGYLYIADRRADLIVSGGANIYPAEVEAAISEHSGVADVAVVGLADEEWGRRVHAVIQPVDWDNAPSIEELRAHCRDRLAAYKVPKGFELRRLLPRTEAGKINRSELAPG